MTTRNTIAQQALRVLDQRGEYAMIPILMNRMFPDMPHSAWKDHGFCHLQDGSSVQHQHGQYTFHWRDDDGVHTQVRVSAMPHSGRPDTTAVRMPIINDPTVEDIWSRVIQILEERAGLDLNEPLVNRAETYCLAPGLHAAVQDSVEKLDLNRFVDKHQDTILSECAAYVLANLPAPQTEKVTKLITHRGRVLD